ncbi:MAG: hypothetical protein Q9225_001766, partial [Loekoesia sp. 1 TL-2023]
MSDKTVMSPRTTTTSAPRPLRLSIKLRAAWRSSPLRLWNTKCLAPRENIQSLRLLPKPPRQPII